MATQRLTSGGPDPLLGKIVSGRFRLDELLGREDRIRSFRARHLELDSVILLRLLMLTDAASERERLRREAEVVMRVEHPQILRALDFGKDEELGALYLASEAVEGQPLIDLIRAKRGLPPAEAIELAVQLASALVAVERAGLKVGGISAKDVRVLAGAVKIGRFLSRSSSGRETLGLGMLIHEILGGRPSGALTGLLERATSSNKAVRFGSLQEMLEALEAQRK